MKPRATASRPPAAAGAPLAAASTPPADELITHLARWFRASARDLPWRVPATQGSPDRDGYHSLVAEVMLQQTQVSRVLPRFLAFIERFPTPAALAAATEAEVLSAWAGLGYYRRARLLHAAAKALVADHPSTSPSHFPRTAQALRTLPGVGRYTAGSIASIAFGEPEPIVDANVARVLLRVHGVQLPHAAPATLEWAWSRATPLAHRAHSLNLIRDFNEGLMELGATVCTPAPSAPKCDQCPIARCCAARALGLQAQIPSPKAATRRTHLRHAVVLLRDRQGRYLLEQRGVTSIWANLWQFATVELAVDADAAPADAAELTRADIARMHAALGLPASVTLAAHPTIAPFSRTLSHRVVHFVVLAAGVPMPARELANLARGNPRRALRALSDLADIPLSTPHRLIADALAATPR